VEDSPAVGDADDGAVGGGRTSVAAEGLVPRERAGRDSGQGEIPDRASLAKATCPADGLVGGEATVADREAGAGPAPDPPASERVSARVAERSVVGESVVGQGQRAANVQDASAPAAAPGSAAAALGLSVFDRHTGNGDGDRLLVLADVKDPAGVVAA